MLNGKPRIRSLDLNPLIINFLRRWEREIVDRSNLFIEAINVLKSVGGYLGLNSSSWTGTIAHERTAPFSCELMCVGGLETIKNSWRSVNPRQWAHAPSCLGPEQKTRQLCTSLSVPTGVDRLISSKLNAYWATFNKFLWLPYTFERDFDPPMLTFHLRCCWTMGPCSYCGDSSFHSINYFLWRLPSRHFIIGRKSLRLIYL